MLDGCADFGPMKREADELFGRTLVEIRDWGKLEVESSKGRVWWDSG
jgi:hypothetical protein